MAAARVPAGRARDRPHVTAQRGGRSASAARVRRGDRKDCARSLVGPQSDLTSQETTSRCTAQVEQPACLRRRRQASRAAVCHSASSDAAAPTSRTIGPSPPQTRRAQREHSHSPDGISFESARTAATARAATAPWKSKLDRRREPRSPSDDRVDGNSMAKSSGRHTSSVAHRSQRHHGTSIRSVSRLRPQEAQRRLCGDVRLCASSADASSTRRTNSAR